MFIGSAVIGVISQSMDRTIGIVGIHTPIMGAAPSDNLLSLKWVDHDSGLVCMIIKL